MEVGEGGKGGRKGGRNSRMEVGEGGWLVRKGGRKGGRSSRMEVDDKDFVIRVCASIVGLGCPYPPTHLTHLTPPTHLTHLASPHSPHTPHTPPLTSHTSLTYTGVDDLLALHVAHLFIRDPVSLFAEKLEQSVENESDHFEVSLPELTSWLI